MVRRWASWPERSQEGTWKASRSTGTTPVVWFWALLGREGPALPMML